MTGRAPASTPTSYDRGSPDDRESPREHNVVCAKGGKCKGRIHIKEAAHRRGRRLHVAAADAAAVGAAGEARLRGVLSDA